MSVTTIGPRVSVLALSALSAAALHAQRWEATGAAEWSGAKDVHLFNGRITWTANVDPSHWTISAGERRTVLDYEPQAMTFNEFPRRIRKQSIALGGAWRRSLGERWRGTIGADVEKGYSDHRSIWIDEYYRQVFSELGYEQPDPWSWNLSVGGQWDWIPVNRLLDIEVAVGQSRIAPGYERDISSFPFTTIRDRDTLNRLGITAGLESVISRYARLRWEASIGWTSERDARIGSRIQLHTALNDHWVIRTEGSASREGEGFEAWSIQMTLEFDLDDRWFFGVTGRIYEDTGEIEESLAVSSAAPALQAQRMGFVVRYLSDRHSFRAYVGPYISNYGAPSDPRVVPFGNLYRDRDWWQAELAYRFSY